MINKFYQIKTNFGLSSFLLHILAIIFMLLDHLGKTILIDYNFLTYIGRLAFPIFAFLIVEGFFHTKNLNKYISRLFIFALISEIPFNLIVNNSILYPHHQNVIWTFLLAIICMTIFKKTNTIANDLKFAFYPLILIIFFSLGIILKTDYNGLGILTVLLFYLTKIINKKSKYSKFLITIIQIIGLYLINCNFNSKLIFSFNFLDLNIIFYKQNIAILSLLFIWLYNNKQGLYNNYIKYFYYLFYPTHMIILWILKVLFY